MNDDWTWSKWFYHVVIVRIVSMILYLLGKVFD